MSDQVIRVSSIEDRVKRSRLNNVIDSLNNYVSCTTNDTTSQDYGMISYCGDLKVGQIIHGNKRPRKSGTPIIVSNTYLGLLATDGSLTVENNCCSVIGYCTDPPPSFCNINVGYANFSNASSSCTCPEPTVRCCCRTCENCKDECGNCYTLDKTLCEYTTCLIQVCAFSNAYPGNNNYEDPATWLRCHNIDPGYCCGASFNCTYAYYAFGCEAHGDNPNSIYYCYCVSATYMKVCGGNVCCWNDSTQCKVLITDGLDAAVRGLGFCVVPPPTGEYWNKTKTGIIGSNLDRVCISLTTCYVCDYWIVKCIRPIRKICFNVRYY